MVPVRRVAEILLVAGALVLLMSLGNWQMRRLEWKQDLIARVADRMAAEPLDLRGAEPSELNRPGFLHDNEYRPVILDGMFDPQMTVRSYTALSDPAGLYQGPGYWIMTLFRLEGGQSLFINRGFVPFDHEADVLPPPAGDLQVTGIVRAPEPGNYMTPEPDIGNRIWYVRNITQMASALSAGSAVLPYFIDADASLTPEGGLPQAGETRTVFSNSHLQYAITWYGLALALVCVFAVYLYSRRQGTTA